MEPKQARYLVELSLKIIIGLLIELSNLYFLLDFISSPLYLIQGLLGKIVLKPSQF